MFGQYQIDLAITDYRMNEMTGLELLELIHNVQPATKVIFITAFGSDELEAQVNNLNAFAYLKKPLDLNTFRSIVLQALGDLANNKMGLIIQDDDMNSYVENSLQLIKSKVSARR
jgi:DNA-binding NtrC family response regulator